LVQSCGAVQLLVRPDSSTEASKHSGYSKDVSVEDLQYPFHDRTLTVTACGRICIGRRKINLSGVFAGQRVGVKQVEEKIWLVSFMRYDLGFFDHETCRIESAENPFAAKLLPMSPV